jgi:hypothetical protein
MANMLVLNVEEVNFIIFFSQNPLFRIGIRIFDPFCLEACMKRVEVASQIPNLLFNLPQINHKFLILDLFILDGIVYFLEIDVQLAEGRQNILTYDPILEVVELFVEPGYVGEDELFFGKALVKEASQVESSVYFSDVLRLNVEIVGLDDHLGQKYQQIDEFVDVAAEILPI